MEEESMLPAFAPGDRVLTFNWGKIKRGDVVVFGKDGREYIKRIDKIKRGQVFVSGDNKRESSRFEPILIVQIVGKVILKY